MTKIHKTVFGQGEPVVMLHGWAMHSRIWRTFAQQLASDRQIVCLDLPGHGGSESVSPYVLDSVVDALLKAFPEQPCTLIGWSLGGSVALRLAEKYPDRVQGLVMISSNPYFLKAEDWAGVELSVLTAFAQSLQKNCAATLLRFMSLQVQGMVNMKSYLTQIKGAVQAYAPPTSEVLMGGLNILQTADLRGALGGLTMPVQVVLGEQDSLVPVAVGVQCRGCQMATELHIIEGARHVPFITHQQQVLGIVQHFMARSGC